MSRLVLIETYWNVKSRPAAEEVRLPIVLIETYWNVKADVSDNIITIFPY